MSSIAIWPGSGSAVSESTPFGFYDTDADFQADAPNFATWSARKLGYPIMDIEMQDINFYACFEEAVTEYSSQVNQFRIKENLINLQGYQTGSNLTHKNILPTPGNIISIAEDYGTEAGSGGNVNWKSARINLTISQQTYDLNKLIASASEGGKAIEVKRIFHEAPPAVARYFDPFVGTGLGSAQMLDSFGWSNFSAGVSFLLTPTFADALRLQAIEFHDKIRKSAFSFELHNNQLRIFPIPRENFPVYIQYIVKEERFNPIKTVSGSGDGVISDYSNATFDNMVYLQINDVGKHWIRRYGLALSKELLGIIRSKYSSVPIPGSEVTLDGESLKSEAITDKDSLIEELRENLDLTTRRAQLEKERDEAEFLKDRLNNFPFNIYIG